MPDTVEGRKIPVLKDDTSWYLTWDQMLHMDRHILDGNDSREGLDYAEYLRLFLFLMNREVKYRRMTHLMEKKHTAITGIQSFPHGGLCLWNPGGVLLPDGRRSRLQGADGAFILKQERG